MTAESAPRSIFKPAPRGEKRGPLVAVEGLDGSGKTTVARGVAEMLRAAGHDPVLSNWNDTTEIYNLMMRLNAAGDLSTHERCIFSSVELAARYHYVIRPALTAGRVVVVTKYVVSALAHSIVRGHDPAFLRRLYDFAYEPDLTVHLEVPPEVALARKAADGGIGFWEAGLDLALDVPLDDALRRYATGQLSASSVTRSFTSFQATLADLHRQLLDGTEVVRIPADAPVEDVITQAASAVITTLSRQVAGTGSPEPVTAARS